MYTSENWVLDNLPMANGFFKLGFEGKLPVMLKAIIIFARERAVAKFLGKKKNPNTMS